MKKSLAYFVLIFTWFVLDAVRVQAQHFISVQSADKMPFAVSVNGGNVDTAKNGAIKLSNLSAGTYKLLVRVTGKNNAAQSFNCVIGKDDASFMLKNLGKSGWILKNINNGQVIPASTDLWDEEPEGRSAPASNGFALMLAQVADDSDLLKPTVWVYTDKISGQDVTDSGAAPPQLTDDGSTYGGGTKGVIKLTDQEINGTKELVFYDFTPNGGDTVRLTYAITDMAGDTAIDSSQLVQNKTTVDSVGKIKTDAMTVLNQPTSSTDSVLNKQTVAKSTAPLLGEDSLLTGRSIKNVPPVEVLDTSAKKNFNNPFFNKVTAQVADTSLRADVAPIASTVDTTTGRYTPTSPPQPEEVAKTTAVAKSPVADTSQQKATADTTVPTVLVKADCKKMLTDNAAEKLKHKIYLETDEAQMANIAKNYLDGKCITTEQVKTLANYFSTDDSRLNFFKAVYPFVYDYGNFGALEKYMIDKHYKEMFRAILK